jgi:hypothetical protein
MRLVARCLSVFNVFFAWYFQWMFFSGLKGRALKDPAKECWISSSIHGDNQTVKRGDASGLMGYRGLSRCEQVSKRDWKFRGEEIPMSLNQWTDSGLPGGKQSCFRPEGLRECAASRIAQKKDKQACGAECPEGQRQMCPTLAGFRYCIYKIDFQGRKSYVFPFRVTDRPEGKTLGLSWA